MTIHTEEELKGLQSAGRLVSSVLCRMARAAEVGMTTAELDALGEKWLAEGGGESAPRLTYGFPGATCISINEEIAHGVPGPRRFVAGDMVNIDVSARLDKYFADTGASFVVPPDNLVMKRVRAATHAALDAAAREVRPGVSLNRIGHAIEGVARRRGLRIVRNLCSHGVGNALHEEPGVIPGYYDPRDRRTMWQGMVFTIEPFLSTKARAAYDAGDGWTLVGPKGSISAQYEHTIVVGPHGPIIVTNFDDLPS
jgi:methionyl aminopeptidase